MRLAVLSVLVTLAVLVGGCSPSGPATPTTPAAPAAAPTSAPASQASSDSSGGYGYGAYGSSGTAASSGSGGTEGGASVAVKGLAFAPKTITVKAGQAVTWAQQDDVTHTVTADDESWDSGALASGKSFSHTFDNAGTFTYHCAIHASMKGTVVVQ